MKKIKKLFNRFRSLSLKKRLLVGLVIFILLIIIINLLSLDRYELALLELRKSVVSETICHEDCSLKRARLRNFVADGLNNSSFLEKKIKKYFNSEDEDIIFKKELVKIARIHYGPNQLPNYLKKYLNLIDGNITLQTEIITTFNGITLPKSSLSFRLKKIVNNQSIYLADRLNALKMLSLINLGSMADYYLSLLSDHNVAISREAVIALSSIQEKEKYLSLDQLKEIEEIIVNQETDKDIRWALILLINDYYSVFPKKSILVLKNIYQSIDQDKTGQALAADSLNNIVGWKKYQVTNISQIDKGSY